MNAWVLQSQQTGDIRPTVANIIYTSFIRQKRQ